MYVFMYVIMYVFMYVSYLCMYYPFWLNVCMYLIIISGAEQSVSLQKDSLPSGTKKEHDSRVKEYAGKFAKDFADELGIPYEAI